MRKQLYRLLPKAKYCPMKNGGDFPYLSHFQEFTMLLQVHLRRVGLYQNEHRFAMSGMQKIVGTRNKLDIDFNEGRTQQIRLKEVPISSSLIHQHTGTSSRGRKDGGVFDTRTNTDDEKR